jgi:hypothetical protein
MARATSSNQPQSIVCSPVSRLSSSSKCLQVSVTPFRVIFGKESSRVSRPGEDSTLGRMGGGRHVGHYGPVWFCLWDAVVHAGERPLAGIA